MTSVFSKELLSKCQFKWQNLVGKELLIKVGTTPDELGKGMHVCVVGVDKTAGISVYCTQLHQRRNIRLGSL